MKSAHTYAPVKDQCRFVTPIILLAVALAAPSIAAEIITIEMESQVLDLDAGTVSDALIVDPTIQTGADAKLAYNADRAVHAVVVLVGEGTEIAFLANTGFDDITSSDVSNLTFSSESIDLPFSANDCVVIRTDQDAFFKLGNAAESGMSVTFNYELL